MSSAKTTVGPEMAHSIYTASGIGLTTLPMENNTIKFVWFESNSGTLKGSRLTVFPPESAHYNETVSVPNLGEMWFVPRSPSLPEHESKLLAYFSPLYREKSCHPFREDWGTIYPDLARKPNFRMTTLNPQGEMK